MIERIFGVLKQRFRILLLPPHYPLNLQPRIPVALCALQNFIRQTDANEGTIPMDPHQPLPYNDDNDNNDGGFIIEDEDGNSEVELRRMNIANAMWGSYLEYLANAGTVDSESDFFSE